MYLENYVVEVPCLKWWQRYGKIEVKRTNKLWQQLYYTNILQYREILRLELLLKVLLVCGQYFKTPFTQAGKTSQQIHCT